VTSLCAELSIAEDNQLNGFEYEHFIEQLLKCLYIEGIPDIMLHSAACIYHIVELIPESAIVLVNHNGVQILIDKITNIEYIDVAENCIKVIEKISVEHANVIVENHAFSVLINYIDFFMLNI